MPYVTDQDFTPLIQTIAWLCLALTIFAIIARAITKAAVIRVVSLDDWLSSIALLFSIGQMVTVLIGTTNGTGKPIGSLKPWQLQAVEKSGFASDFLYIASLCFTKLSVLALLRLITPSRRNQVVIWTFEAFTATWTMVALFAHAFECHVPATWDFVGGQCFDRLAWWNYFEITNLITDVSLIALPLAIVFPVQTTIKRKATIVGFFAIRIMTVAAEITKLVYWNRLYTSPDPNLAWWPVIISTEAIQCSSITATCALYLRPFLEMLQSGFLNLDDMRRKGMMTPFTLTTNKQTGKLAVSGTTYRPSQERPIGRFERLNEKIESSDNSDGIFRGRGNTEAKSKDEDLLTKRWTICRDA